MKFYEMGLVLKHPWEQVVQSFWQRYPNPYRWAEILIGKKDESNMLTV